MRCYHSPDKYPSDRASNRIAIVGSGFAGQALACHLSRLGVNSVIFEAGGLHGELLKQDFLKGFTAGSNHADLHKYRDSRVGGTSARWGGRLGTVTATEFEAWPIEYDEFKLFEDLALELFGLTRRALAVDSSSGVHRGVWSFSEPRRLHKKDGSWIVDHDSIDLVSHARVLDVSYEETATGSHRVSELIFEGRNPSSARCRLPVDKVIFANGGLESCRLLLCLDARLRNAGSEPISDHLGKHYASHLSGSVGPVSIRRDALSYLQLQGDRTSGYVKPYYGIQDRTGDGSVSSDIRLSLGTPNPSNPDHGDALLSLICLAKVLTRRLIPPELVSLNNSGKKLFVGRHLRNIFVDLVGLTRSLLVLLLDRGRVGFRIPEIATKAPLAGSVYLHFDASQSMTDSNLVSLAGETDCAGIPRLMVDWSVHSKEIGAVRNALRSLLPHVIEDVGLDALVAGVVGSRMSVGSHHLCAARMGTGRQDGVVSRDLQVFGFTNLFVLSPAAFRSSLVVNPTLPLVALAIRLADHLSGSPVANTG